MRYISRRALSVITITMSKIVVVLLIASTVWGILICSHLVHDKNRRLAAWSDIDVQLKRRYDLIPKLVDAVK